MSERVAKSPGSRRPGRAVRLVTPSAGVSIEQRLQKTSQQARVGSTCLAEVTEGSARKSFPRASRSLQRRVVPLTGVVRDSIKADAAREALSTVPAPPSSPLSDVLRTKEQGARIKEPTRALVYLHAGEQQRPAVRGAEPRSEGGRSMEQRIGREPSLSAVRPLVP